MTPWQRQEFSGMSASQRRRAVAIAIDCLKVTARKRSVAVLACNGFLAFSPPEEPPYGQDLQSLLPTLITPTRPCQICAQGGLFLSFVRLYDRVQYTGYVVGGNQIRRELRTVFSCSQLALIESAFEQTDRSYANCAFQPANLDDAIAFGRCEPDDRRRLRLILRNIIRNKGVFVPQETSV